MTLKSAYDRDDGLPWVRWVDPTTHYPHLIGCRERVTLCAWYDREQQRLVVTCERFDESMHEYEPCWAQVGLIDVGPFFGAGDVLALIRRWTEQVMEMAGTLDIETE